MLTYGRKGWEFHAKGLWFFEGKEAITAVGQPRQHCSIWLAFLHPPLDAFFPGWIDPSCKVCAVFFSWFTCLISLVVGSSNLGVRSAELDLELQFVVLTRNQELR